MQKLEVNGFTIHLELKKIKHTYLKINRAGEILLSAPFSLSNSSILKFIDSKIDWLNKHKKHIENPSLNKAQSSQNEDIINFFGKSYAIKIVNVSDFGNPRVIDEKLEIYINPNNKKITPKYLVNKFLLSELYKHSDQLFAKWQEVIGVKIKSYKIKKMTSRWGSCNIVDHKISLNFELVKYPVRCLEYVVVHELVHLLEPSHNHRFKAFMTKFLPDWKVSSKILKDGIYS